MRSTRSVPRFWVYGYSARLEIYNGETIVFADNMQGKHFLQFNLSAKSCHGFFSIGCTFFSNAFLVDFLCLHVANKQFKVLNLFYHLRGNTHGDPTLNNFLSLIPNRLSEFSNISLNCVDIEGQSK